MQLVRVPRFRRDQDRPAGRQQEVAAAAAGEPRRRSGSGIDPAAILASLAEREQLGSTGFGQGVAIPHGKIEGLSRIYGLFARLAEPVDYKAIDGGRSTWSSCSCRRPMPGPSI